MSTTTNFGWTKPTVYGDVNVWGAPLNNNLDSQDSYMKLALTSNAAATEPTYKALGTTWLDTSSSPYTLKIYDGTDWATIGTLNPTTNNFIVSSAGFSVGDYKWSALTADHDGWLLCDGSTYDPNTYTGLASVIGTVFGGGTQYKVPDMRGHVAGAVGQGTDQSGNALTNRTEGENIGYETHTLTEDEMPAHNHISGCGDTFPNGGRYGRVDTGLAARRSGYGNADNSNFGDYSSETGGDTPHNNMQPTLFIGNMFIYSGV